MEHESGAYPTSGAQAYCSAESLLGWELLRGLPLPEITSHALILLVQRFHALATEGRMALLVTSTAPAAGATLYAANGRQCRSCHSTLQSALSCSRYGP